MSSDEPAESKAPIRASVQDLMIIRAEIPENSFPDFVVWPIQ